MEIWGSGKPLREFTYSFDVAKIINLLLNSYDALEPINIGNTKEYSIKSIAQQIKSIFDYNGELLFNTDKPDGQFRKPSSNAKLIELTSWTKKDYTPFNVALKETCFWFQKNYPDVRGISNSEK